jgi:hypothetical protein
LQLTHNQYHPTRKISTIMSDIEELKSSFINSQKLSDVTFIFADNGQQQTIFGHKVILASNSVVFAKMFLGDFDEKQVRIEDIKYGDFMDLIKYLYTGALELTKKNMAELLYAAQKYLLKAVKTKAEKFILTNTDSSNLLKIMNASQCFENPEISEMCLNIFCDDPIYFLTEHFLDLSVESFKMIVNQQRMNCSELQLKTFTQKWLNKNFQSDLKVLMNNDEFQQNLLEHTGIESWQLGPKSLFNIATHFYYGQFEVSSFSINKIFIKNEKRIYLHGIGIHVGVFPEHKETSGMMSYFDETIDVILYERDVDSNNYACKRLNMFKIKQKTTASVECVLFKKLKLTRDFAIRVDFPNKKPRTILSRNTITGDIGNNLNIISTQKDDRGFEKNYNCLAYILTSAASKSK